MSKMEPETTVSKRKSLLCLKSTDLPIQSFQLPKWGIDVTLKNRIDDIKEVWDDLTPRESFAQSAYLRTLENTNPEKLKNLYVVLKKKDEAIGVVLLQSLVLKLSDSFDYGNYTTDRSSFSRLWQRFRQIAISWITFRMLTVGNLYLTGQYGIHFKGSDIGKEDQFLILKDLLKVLKKELCGTEYRFKGILYKDFYQKQSPDQPSKLSLYPFSIDPNMILTIRKSWTTFDDYLLDMKSKYRVRLKNAMKKFKGIERKVIDAENLPEYNERMYELYGKILEGSGFVLAQGNSDYFIELKKQLGAELNIVGYFNEGQLVGFYTWVLEGSKMDSHFIGFDPKLNMKFQLYLNILLDLVRDSIGQRAESLYYFRTALEIKSSVGAEPHEMYCFFKHSNILLNKVVVPIAFKYFVPQQIWKQRHPFKLYSD